MTNAIAPAQATVCPEASRGPSSPRQRPPREKNQVGTDTGGDGRWKMGGSRSPPLPHTRSTKEEALNHGVNLARATSHQPVSAALHLVAVSAARKSCSSRRWEGVVDCFLQASTNQLAAAKKKRTKKNSCIRVDGAVARRRAPSELPLDASFFNPISRTESYSSK